VRLLAWLLVVLTPLVGAVFIVVFVVNPTADPRRGEYAFLLAGLLLMLTAALALNHAGRYTAAAHLTVLCAFAGPWGAVALDHAILRGDFVPLTYVTIPILISGVLLTARITALFAAVQFVALWILLAFTPAAAAVNWPSLCILVLTVSVLSVIANFVNRKDLDQIGRQNLLLAETGAVLREQSVRDALTGLFNRRYLEETLARELRRAERSETAVGIIMLDIDHFKRFNDSHGHAAGDAVLRALGGFLLASVRSADIACRYGGEEFTLILLDASRQMVEGRAERLREDARNLHVQFEGKALEAVTLSLGVSFFPDHGSTGPAVLRAGDAALYRAKREGRDRVVVAE
jgi:diguanylate cyclase (GGDEF)-like protein